MYTKIASESLTAMNSSFVDWRVVAAWIETEGSVDSTVTFRKNPTTGAYYPTVARAILIPQKERTPLAAIQQFLEEHGVFSTIQHIVPSRTAYSQNPYFRLAIQRVDDLDIVIENVKGYLLTRKTSYQIEEFSRRRHMKAAQLRAEFLSDWLDSDRNRKRKGGKGSNVY